MNGPITALSCDGVDWIDDGILLLCSIREQPSVDTPAVRRYASTPIL